MKEMVVFAKIIRIKLLQCHKVLIHAVDTRLDRGIKTTRGMLTFLVCFYNREGLLLADKTLVVGLFKVAKLTKSVNKITRPRH
jgi:hypothetical protein